MSLEKPKKSNEEKVADKYLKGLATSWEHFQGKKLLDIGGGAGAEFSSAAKKKGIDIVSLDSRPGDEAASKETMYVQADALMLPFADGSFDEIICYGGPLIFQKPEMYKEAFRVLKDGGELRVGPAFWPKHIDTNIFWDESPELQEKRLKLGEVVHKTAEEYLTHLSDEIGYAALEYVRHPSQGNGTPQSHFVLKK